MTDAHRKSLLAALEELGALYPSMRFGQLVANVVTFARGPADQQDWAGAVWDIGDEEMLDAIRSHLAKHATSSTCLGDLQPTALTEQNQPPSTLE